MTWGLGYESQSVLLHFNVLQSISPLCIAYSIIKGQFLSYHSDMLWEVKNPVSWLFSFSSRTLYHRHDITEIQLLWRRTDENQIHTHVHNLPTHLHAPTHPNTYPHKHSKTHSHTQTGSVFVVLIFVSSVGGISI